MKKERFMKNVGIDKDTYKRVKAQAAKEDRNTTNMINVLLKRALDMGCPRFLGGKETADHGRN